MKKYSKITTTNLEPNIKKENESLKIEHKKIDDDLIEEMVALIKKGREIRERYGEKRCVL
ncbi:hypothetical protein GYA19_02150 [Candidatus Beckwithbacteria bacterium]|nr:hypothetical protein [Candidatus Beckwithbacteria bacterium]